MKTPVVASIGTTHPWNIAGVGLDAHVAAEYGLEHAAVVVAVSAQDEDGLHALHAVPPDVVRAQLQALPAGIAAVRIGALVTSETIRVIADFVERLHAGVHVVLDPVLGASLGGTLELGTGVAAALRDLAHLPLYVTPNLDEACVLTGIAVRTQTDMETAARALVKYGARGAYVKGGHLRGDPADVFATANTLAIYSGARLPGAMRGSGCTLAASLACELALGSDAAAAAEAARAYVRRKIEARRMRGNLQTAF